MKKTLKVIGYVVGAVVIILLGLVGYYAYSRTSAIHAAREKMGRPADTLRVDGFAFRDLNKNGKLDPYEDRRNPIRVRVENLLGQMTLQEKAGTLFHTFVWPGKNGEIAGPLNCGTPLELQELYGNPQKSSSGGSHAPYATQQQPENVMRRRARVRRGVRRFRAVARRAPGRQRHHRSHHRATPVCVCQDWPDFRYQR